MTDVLQVVTTCGSRDDANRIADAVVTRRLAGCAQVNGPITSHYHWQGQKETSEEWIVMMKTRRDRYDALQSLILDLHPYEVPQIVATAIVDGSEDYLKWIYQEVS
jgi:periplasmic divalent cation tolerance protein